MGESHRRKMTPAYYKARAQESAYLLTSLGKAPVIQQIVSKVPMVQRPRKYPVACQFAEDGEVVCRYND